MQEPEVTVSVTEELGRRPMVTLAWTLEDPNTEIAEALEFGSLLLTIATDGFIGMEVSSSYLAFTGGGMFVLQVTMPHATDKGEAWGNADVVFRYLARAPMPAELVGATLLAWDQNLMARLESSDARASLLTALEVSPRAASPGLTPNDRHWAITPQSHSDLRRDRAERQAGGDSVEADAPAASEIFSMRALLFAVLLAGCAALPVKEQASAQPELPRAT